MKKIDTYIAGNERNSKNLYKDYGKSLPSGIKRNRETTIEFLISNPNGSDNGLLGRYNSNYDKIDIFLGKIGEVCYKKIKTENKDLFDFVESKSNKKSNALDRNCFEDVVDEQLFAYTKDKITEVLLHELTHKFGKAYHPQDCKAGMRYFINSYISKLYTEVSFPDMEKEAKEVLKNCYNIQSYTTNDFNSKIRKLIDYCNDR
ncbi:hypothetical protein M1558_04185 [Candidatus Parvarchaeota archaeon]|nr:hypothetical protein [Candidatus Parvarchaeota archaeon]